MTPITGNIPPVEFLFGFINLIVVGLCLFFLNKRYFRFLRGSNVREWCFQGSGFFYVSSLLGFLFNIPVVIFRNNETVQEQALGNLLLGTALFLSFLLITLYAHLCKSK